MVGKLYMTSAVLSSHSAFYADRQFAELKDKNTLERQISSLDVNLKTQSCINVEHHSKVKRIHLPSLLNQ